MKRLAIILAVLMTDVSATPFIYSGYSNQPVLSSTSTCKVFVDTKLWKEAPVDGSNILFWRCKVDLAGSVVGSHTATAQYCNHDSVWGSLCSVDSAPVNFTVPGNPSAPAGLSVGQ